MWIIQDPDKNQFVGVEDSMWDEIEMAQYYYDEEAAGSQLRYLVANIQFIPGLDEETITRCELLQV